MQIADVVLCKDVFVALTNNFCRKSANVTEVVTGVINTVTDFYLFVLPIPIILRLRLPRRRKIGVFIVLGAGFMYVFKCEQRIFEQDSQLLKCLCS